MHKIDDTTSKFYQDATPYIKSLLKDPDNEALEKEIDIINQRIYQDNIERGVLEGEADVLTIAFWDLLAVAQPGFEHQRALSRNSKDQFAREKLAEVVKAQEDFNKENRYPNTWVFDMPPAPEPLNRHALESEWRLNNCPICDDECESKRAVTR